MARFNRLIVLILTIAIAFFTGESPTYPAEKIKFNYSILGFSLNVEDLALYANEGKVTRQLNFYLKRFSESQQKQLQDFLQLNYEIDPILVYRFSRTSVGQKMLLRIGEILQTPHDINGFYGLRAAAVKTASDSEGVNLVNFLRYFPTELKLNLPEILKLVKHVAKNSQETDEFIASLSKLDSELNYKVKAAEFSDLSIPGRFSVTKQELNLNDASRNNRSLLVDLYLPQSQHPKAKAKYPVIVVSNGLGARRSRFVELAQHLASYGFAIAIPDHPGTNHQRQADFIKGLYKENFDAQDFIDRPLDISFVLDELDQLNQNKFNNQLNVEQAGIFGYSFGGATALSLTGATLNFEQLQQDCDRPLDLLNISILYQCRALELPRQEVDLQDRRIKATYMFVPFGSSLFGEEQLRQIAAPTMWQTVDRDFLTSLLKEQLPAFQALGSHQKYLVVSEKLPHTTATLDQKRSQSQNLESDISKKYQNALALAFFQTYVTQNADYLPYLSSDYLNVLSQKPYNLHLLESQLSQKQADIH